MLKVKQVKTIWNPRNSVRISVAIRSCAVGAVWIHVCVFNWQRIAFFPFDKTNTLDERGCGVDERYRRPEAHPRKHILTTQISYGFFSGQTVYSLDKWKGITLGQNK